MRFHGQLLYQLNSKPLKSYSINLNHEYYDGGSSTREILGSLLTNNDGTFEIIENVQRYSQEYFNFEIYDPSNPLAYHYYCKANVDGSYQTIYFPTTGGIRFHIKNIMSVDSNDRIDNYLVTLDTTVFVLPVQLGLEGVGMNVDIYKIKYPVLHNMLYYFNYEYRKNGITYTASFDTIRTHNEDTVVANIFY